MAVSLGTPSRRLVPVLSSVVDAIVAKLEIDEERLAANKVKDAKTFRAWLGDGHWSLVEKELYRAVVRDGSAYVLTMWADGVPVFTVREMFNGVCGARVVCEDGVPAYAFNAWSADDGVAYADFYYPDRVEKYRKSDDKKHWIPRTDAPDEAWPIAWVAEDGTPLGIAIVEFSIGESDIASSLQIARDINEALLDLLATSRTQGWPQRFLKGGRTADVLTNAFGQAVVNGSGNPIRRTVQASPGSIMLLSETSELGQLNPAASDSTVLDKLLELLSLVTTVPTHYFIGQWPSGVALIQAESRLNHKVEQHQAKISAAVVTMLRLAMRLANHFAGATYDPTQPITIPWHSPEIETDDLRREREAFKVDRVSKLVESGLMSRELAVRELHPNFDEMQIQAELARLGSQ